MKTSTAGKNSSTVRITVAVALLAGAGLSGCAGDPYYGNPGYSQGYNQPSPSDYYDPSHSHLQGPYYVDRPSGYRHQSR